MVDLAFAERGNYVYMCINSICIPAAGDMASHTAKLPLHQNRLVWLHISLWKSGLHVHLGHGDVTWNHYNPDRYKDGIFTEKYSCQSLF